MIRVVLLNGYTLEYCDDATVTCDGTWWLVSGRCLVKSSFDPVAVEMQSWDKFIVGGPNSVVSIEAVAA